MLLCVVVLAGYIFAIIKSTPELDVNAVLSLSEPSALYDDEGNFIDKIPTEQIREIIDFEEMPQHLKDAYVAIEDERFYEHNGVDFKRTIVSAIRLPLL